MERKNKGQSVKVGKGRKSLIDPARLAELKEQVSVKNMSGDSVRKKQLRTIVRGEINQGLSDSKMLVMPSAQPEPEPKMLFCQDNRKEQATQCAVSYPAALFPFVVSQLLLAAATSH